MTTTDKRRLDELVGVDTGALEILGKPYDIERLSQAVGRASVRVSATAAPDRPPAQARTDARPTGAAVTDADPARLRVGMEVKMIDGRVGLLKLRHIDTGSWAIEMQPGSIRVLPNSMLARPSDGTLIERRAEPKA